MNNPKITDAAVEAAEAARSSSGWVQRKCPQCDGHGYLCGEDVELNVPCWRCNGNKQISLQSEPVAMRAALEAALPHMQQAGVALDYVPGNVDRTAPERIWLQVNAHDGNDDRDETFPRNEGNVTWCASSCGGLEIQYVRADLATTPAQPEAGVPEGYVLVPEKIGVPAENWEAAQFAFGGPGTGEGEAFMDCTLWIGEITDDDGKLIHGLHVSCDECPEEGSITLSAFPAPLAAAGRGG